MESFLVNQAILTPIQSPLDRFYMQTAEPSMFQNIPDYFINDIDLWSMADLVAVKNGSFVNFLQHLIQQGEGHISKCEVRW